MFDELQPTLNNENSLRFALCFHAGSTGERLLGSYFHHVFVGLFVYHDFQ